MEFTCGERRNPTLLDLQTQTCVCRMRLPDTWKEHMESTFIQSEERVRQTHAATGHMEWQLQAFHLRRDLLKQLSS